jgi:hypothetical protein
VPAGGVAAVATGAAAVGADWAGAAALDCAAAAGVSPAAAKAIAHPISLIDTPDSAWNGNADAHPICEAL